MKQKLPALVVIALLTLPVTSFALDEGKSFNEKETRQDMRQERQQGKADERRLSSNDEDGDAGEKQAPASFTECSQAAIELRDTALAASRSLYNSAMNTALSERKTREKAAIALGTEKEKKEAIKSSAEAYKNKVKAAQNTLTDARKATWEIFEETVTSCRSTFEEEKSDTEDSASSFHKEDEKTAKEVGADGKDVNKNKEGKCFRDSIIGSIKSLFE